MKRDNLIFGAVLGIALIAAGSVFAQEKKAEAKSPKQVCEALVEAAKKDDFEGFKQWTMGWHPSHRMNDMAGKVMKDGMHKNKEAKMEKGFHHMHKNHMSQLKDLSCGDEKIAGTHAFVETESKGEKRLVPFAQKDGMWMFDSRTYMSFYRDSMPKHAGHMKNHG